MGETLGALTNPTLIPFLLFSSSSLISLTACAPVELLKCRAQAQLTAEQARIELNPLSCARYIIKQRGMYAYLYPLFWRGIL
jgi:hypothetical protein